jgi:hypothetical protein
MGVSPIRSSVLMLPTTTVVAPCAIFAGAAIEKLRQYRPVNAVGWALTVVGFGVLSLLNADNSTSEWVCFQIIVSIGTGIMVRVVTLITALQILKGPCSMFQQYSRF